jgi:hypothetical protein
LDTESETGVDGCYVGGSLGIDLLALTRLLIVEDILLVRERAVFVILARDRLISKIGCPGCLRMLELSLMSVLTTYVDVVDFLSILLLPIS